MFTGLIRHIGTLAWRRARGNGAKLCVGAGPDLIARAAPGASIAVMGACLTVTQRNGDCFEADLSEETLQKTTLGRLAAGSGLHLEPALLVGEPLDGHFVLGHVDCVGALLARPKDEGIWRFSVPPWMAPMLAPKGCIAVDGISLTVVDAFSDSFSVALIPETVSNTMLKDLSPGSKVNIEADPLGRYAVRFLSLSLKNEKLGKFASDGWGAVEG